MSLLKKVPAPVRFIVLAWTTGMLIFFLFRILLFALHTDEVKEIPAAILLQSLVMGSRFDAVINGYLLALPAMLFFLFSFGTGTPLLLRKIISTYLILVYALAFLIHVTDVRWFGHSAARFTVAALQWTDTPGWMLKFVFEDVYNYPLLVLLVILIGAFAWLIRKIDRVSFADEQEAIRQPRRTLTFLLLFALLFAGIRGRFAIKSPIRWGTAFFSSYNFANQAGLNPVYTFMRSWIDRNENAEVKYRFMPDDSANTILREELQIENDAPSSSPVARKVIPAGKPHRYNVVLVLMESMSAKNMTRFGNPDHLTPVLDSLVDRSIASEDFYSDGNHTFNGIYTSLYGFHSLPLVHHMKDLAHQQPYSGIAGTLSSAGYATRFFTTHDDQFDNMAGFLLPNGFQKIISEKNYPGDKVLSTLGVPDHVMFGAAVAEFDALRQPFFAAMITGSNHEPFMLPDHIPLRTHSSSMAEKMVEYADWSVGEFLKEASTHPWFDSTIFVFTGDHGGIISGFDHYLGFHHIPLIMYAPEILKPQLISNVGGQADLYATICGLLNISYVNNSMGVDLLKEHRRFYPFNYDEEMCCISKENFFTTGHGQEHYYTLSADKKNITESDKITQADSMKSFVEAVLQVTQQMIERHQMKAADQPTKQLNN